MQFLKGIFRERSQTVRLPDGRLVRVDLNPTGVAVIRHIEDTDVRHAIVTPAPIHGRFKLPRGRASTITPEDAPLNLDAII